MIVDEPPMSWVPLLVVDNRKGWVSFDEFSWLNTYVSPRTSWSVACESPPITNLPLATVTANGLAVGPSMFIVPPIPPWLPHL